MLKYKNMLQAVVGITVIITAVIFGANRLDHSILFSILNDINLLHLSLASMVIIGVMALSTERFAFINKKFGGNDEWLFLHRVNMLSLLYSQIALPLIAQIIGRVTHGTSQQRVYYAPLTVLEKSIAFTIMLVFGGAAAFLLLNENIIPEGLFTALTIMGGAIILAIGTSIYTIFDKDERRALLATMRKITQIGIFHILGLSVLIQLGILVTYTLLALQFVPDASLTILIGGFAVVVLVTSIPIGFGGWGVREAAAAAVFLALGMPPEIGVVVGLLYGVLHLIILTLSVLLLRGRTNTVAVKAPRAHPFEGVDFWPISFFLMMVLLPFQIRLPMSNGLITLNSVDLLALVIMINFTVIQLLQGQLKTIWADRLMWPGIIGIILLIMYGWLVGWLRFGASEWATVNRLFGLIPVLSYLIAGAAMRRLLSRQMLQKICIVLAFSIVISLCVKTVVYNIFGIEGSIFFNWQHYIHGFIADRNAFSFMGALAAIFLAFNMRHIPADHQINKFAVILITIIIISILFTGSRSGLGAAIFLVLWLVCCMPKHIPTMIITSLIVTLIFNGLNSITNYPDITLVDGRGLSNVLTFHDERIVSLNIGYALFSEYLIFGAGLGAGLRETGLVIHNLYLWILGEMGLVGALLCAPLALAFTRTCWRSIYLPGIRLRDNTNIHGFLLFIIICGGFSLLQDVAYQRILWLLVGYMMAQPLLEKDHY